MSRTYRVVFFDSQHSPEPTPETTFGSITVEGCENMDDAICLAASRVAFVVEEGSVKRTVSEDNVAVLACLHFLKRRWAFTAVPKAEDKWEFAFKRMEASEVEFAVRQAEIAARVFPPMLPEEW